jgi:molybdate transport system substrate-binding protein
VVRQSIHRSCTPILALLLSLTGLIALGAARPVPVHAIAIECSPAATPAAGTSTAASTATVEASPASFPAGGGDLTVFAAASLTGAFGQVKADLEAAHPGLSISYNFAGSQALVTQLSEGAKADVFASAGNAQMDAATEKGVIDGEPTVFAQNRLAVVVPTDNPADLATAADLANDGVKLVLAQAAVPVGQYARQSICLMGADTATYGESFVDRVAVNVVSEEDNVKAVLAKVQLGEADAGIVYTTDVTADVAEDVDLIEIPSAVNVIATYPIAGVTGGNAELARAFIDYVLGPDGQAALHAFGFEPKP